MSAARKPFQRVRARSGRQISGELGAPQQSRRWAQFLPWEQARRATPRRAAAWLLALGVAALLGGCPIFPAGGCGDEEDCGAGFRCSPSTARCEVRGTCAADNDCEYGERCSSGLCVSDCHYSGCKSGYECVDSICLPPSSGGEGGADLGAGGNAEAGAPSSGGVPNFGGMPFGGGNAGGGAGAEQLAGAGG